MFSDSSSTLSLEELYHQFVLWAYAHQLEALVLAVLLPLAWYSFLGLRERLQRKMHNQLAATRSRKFEMSFKQEAPRPRLKQQDGTFAGFRRR